MPKGPKVEDEEEETTFFVPEKKRERERKRETSLVKSITEKTLKFQPKKKLG